MRAQRLVALDVFRGLTVAAMLLVNNPGTWSAIWWPLAHAEWHGWTPTDLIFPFFLFIVGVTTELSFASRRARGDGSAALARRAVERGLLIVLIGLAGAAFPFFPAERLVHLRIPGVMVRIGVTYLVSALVVLGTSIRGRGLVAGALLLGYWLLLAFVPAPGQPQPMLEPPSATLPAYVDRLLLTGHLWSQSRTWDPEGVLSTLPAIATVLLGTFAGRLLAGAAPLGTRIALLVRWGAAGVAVGLAWGLVFPINKALWTSSYAALTAGLAALGLAACLWAIDLRGWTRWTGPFVVFGTNPLVAFVGSEMFARLVYTSVRVEWRGKLRPVQEIVYRTAYAPWLPPRLASAAFAVTVVLLWYLVLRGLWRRGWVVKV